MITAYAGLEKRKAYLRRIVQNHSPEDIFSDERRQQWDAFSHDDQKKIMESKVFVGFVQASGILPDPFEHGNGNPDICTTIQGKAYYFELGEITDQGHRWAESVSMETGEITGCAFSQTDPLLKMFRQKCAKSYLTNGAPVDLVLHFSTQPPYEPLLYEDLRIHAAEIAHLIRGSEFARVWLYSDCRPQKVLWNVSR